MPSQNNVVVACAGSGKTTSIVSAALASPDQRVLITTFTLSNIAEIRQKFINLNGFVPDRVTILPWFTFVLRELVRPYQNLFFRPYRVRSVNLVPGRSDPYAPRADKLRYFFGNSLDVYSDKLSELALYCEQHSDSRVIKRLASQFDAIYIDEVQDLAGYDLELVKLFLASEIDITMVGDHRQATLATNQSPKHKKYRYAGIIDLFQEWEKLGYISLEFMDASHRCRQEICDFSDRCFPDSPPTKSLNDTVTGHDGVFVIAPEVVAKYVQEFSPQVLRYSRATNCDGYAAMNFRVSKGLTFDRVLIYPHKSVREYLKCGDLRMLKEPQLLYVAATRARQSVVFVLDEDCVIPDVSRITFD